jgi:hypothetical protein
MRSKQFSIEQRIARNLARPKQDALSKLELQVLQDQQESNELRKRLSVLAPDRDKR